MKMSRKWHIYYDANHVITMLSEAKIDELLKKYKVEL